MMHSSVQSTKAVVNSPFQQMPKIASPAILRLLQEVKNQGDAKTVGGSYDRTHNRHNRGQ